MQDTWGFRRNEVWERGPWKILFLFKWSRLTPWMAAASADNLEQRAPVLLLGWSNQPISCLNMASKAIFLMRRVKCSPAMVNMAIWLSDIVCNLHFYKRHCRSCLMYVTTHFPFIVSLSCRTLWKLNKVEFLNHGLYNPPHLLAKKIANQFCRIIIPFTFCQ